VAERRADPYGALDRPRTPLEGCAATGAALQDRRLVLLTATAPEAAPLLDALDEPEIFELAGKTLATGRLVCGSGDGEPISAAVSIGGCDKTNTAHMLTSLLHAMCPLPGLVMQVGIAGAFQGLIGAWPEPGDVVLATEEVYADSGSSSPHGWLSADDLELPVGRGVGCDSGIRFALHEDLVRAAVAALDQAGAFAPPTTVEVTARPRVFSGRCLTASRVTGLAAEAAVLLERWGALAESMEGAAAAHICALYRVPFLEVRGISNMITDRDRASWQVERAISVAGQAALAICAALAPGRREAA
jgi:futalosine hydrolase